MSTHNKNKRSVNKGRRWIFSKKKMKDQDNSETAVNDLKTLLELKEIQLKPRVNVIKSSKLSPKLVDILKMSIPLGYFLDFLREHNKKHLLDFWLEAETFQIVSRQPSRRSRGNSMASSYSTQSSPGIQRYRQPLRTYSNVSNLSKTRRKCSLGYDQTPTAECDNNIPQDESCKSINKCLFKSSQEELNITNANSNSNQGADCFCTEVNRRQFNTKLETEILINLDEHNSNKADQINLMHPSNHDWADTSKLNNLHNSSFLSDRDILGDNINICDSLEKSFEGLFMRKTKSSSSMCELSQWSRGRSLIVDAAEIYSKYICGASNLSIDISVEERHQIEGCIANKDCNGLEPNVFAHAQDHVFIELTSLYEEFLHTASMVNYQINLLEERQITFIDVLYDENILFYFMEFLDQTNCKSALEFYIIVQNFEEDIEAKLLNGEYNVEEAVSDAMNIYERYFSMKCDQQLIEDDKLRIVLENNICREEGPQSNCFCIPVAYAWTTLNDIYMPVFFESDIYTSYINHLRKTLFPPDEGRCSSTRSSMSLEDTSPLYEFKGSKLNLLEDNNLEEFWFKDGETSSGLTLGRVNEFGIFNSEMEPEPEQNKGGDSSVSKLGKAVKNFLRRETSEETEQLAWRRAEKIIADIQKETTSESGSSMSMNK